MKRLGGDAATVRSTGLAAVKAAANRPIIIPSTEEVGGAATS